MNGLERECWRCSCFVKKTETVVQPLIVSATARGTVVPMQDIPDPIFSAGVLGTCCGIDPSVGEVYAPMDGKIIQVTDTLHAIGRVSSDGVEILLHVGVDTVEMKGDGFRNLVKTGDSVTRGQLLLTMDLEKIREAKHPATVITIIANSSDFKNIDMIASGVVEPQMDLMSISK